MFFDTHAHFNNNRFKHDRDSVIENTYKNDVKYVLNISNDIPTMYHTISLTKKYDFIYGAVGVHPHFVSSLKDSDIDIIKDLAKNKKIVAIGEIGLDYYRNLSPQDTQKKWFKLQISLAKEVKLPIIIHNRDSDNDMIDIIESENAKVVGGIIHSFSSDVAMAKRVLENNFYISISGPITYNNSKTLQEAVKYIPMERLLIETDSPFLSPEPFRGKRNEPSYVKLVAEKIGEIKNLSTEEVGKITLENAKKLLRIL